MTLAQSVRYGGASVLTVLLMVLLMGLQPAVMAQSGRPTLPPTWTATFTHTPFPTRTPTLTPTITPTLTTAEACATLTIINLNNGQRFYGYDELFQLIFGVELDGVTVSFEAVHRVGRVGVLIDDISRVEMNAIEIPIAALPRHGLYDWKMIVLDEAGTPLCKQGGIFVAGFPVTTTPTPTTQIIIVTPAPEDNDNVIIVTATPTSED